MSGQPGWTPEMAATLRRLLDDPTLWSYKKIAEIIQEESGVPLTRDAVAGKIHRLGWRSTHPRLTQPASGRRSERRALIKAVIAAQPEPLPPVPPAAVRLLNCSLFELHPNSCRWPIGVSESGEHLFCGVVKPLEVSYCAEHRKLSYVRSSR